MPGGGGQERGRRPWIPGARPGEDPREIGERLRAPGVLPGGGGSRAAEEAGRSLGSAGLGLGVGEEERGGPCDVSESELPEPRQGPGGAERDAEIGSGREPQHLERRRRRRRRLGLARPAIGASAHSGPQAPARAHSLPGPSMARAAALRPSRSPPVPTLPLLPLFLMLLREAGETWGCPVLPWTGGWVWGGRRSGPPASPYRLADRQIGHPEPPQPNPPHPLAPGDAHPLHRHPWAPRILPPGSSPGSGAARVKPSPLPRAPSPAGPHQRKAVSVPASLLAWEMQGMSARLLLQAGRGVSGGGEGARPLPQGLPGSEGPGGGGGEEGRDGESRAYEESWGLPSQA